MDPTDLSDAQLDQLADQLAGRLPSGTHGDRVVLSRRAFAAAVGGTLGASGLVALGVDPAAAQAAGQVGTSADPVDAFVYDLDVANALQSDLDAGGNALTNVGSLSTGGLNIGDHETINGIESGSVNLDVGPAPDSSSDTLAIATDTVTFDTAFETTPIVLTSVNTAGGDNIYATARNIDTTGCSIDLKNPSTLDPPARDVYWVALAED